jgi:DNA polymerase I-like protein with 3'-5' exonuclease and polymerase domains
VLNYRKTYRLNGEALDFKLVLGIHDAMMLEVKPQHVEHVVKVMLPYCMSQQCVIPVLNKSLAVDISLGIRWGEEASKKHPEVIKQLIDLGVSETLFN